MILAMSSECFLKVSGWFPCTREVLARLRLRAIRRGVWFRKLNVSERRLMDLVIRVVGRVRSLVLANVLSKIVSKLLSTIEGEVSRFMMMKGRSLARKLGQIAQAWGHKSAATWHEDAAFVRFVTVMNLPAFRAETGEGNA